MTQAGDVLQVGPVDPAVTAARDATRGWPRCARHVAIRRVGGELADHRQGQAARRGRRDGAAIARAMSSCRRSSWSPTRVHRRDRITPAAIAWATSRSSAAISGQGRRGIRRLAGADSRSPRRGARDGHHASTVTRFSSRRSGQSDRNPGSPSASPALVPLPDIATGSSGGCAGTSRGSAADMATALVTDDRARRGAAALPAARDAPRQQRRLVTDETKARGRPSRSPRRRPRERRPGCESGWPRSATTTSSRMPASAGASLARHSRPRSRSCAQSGHDPQLTRVGVADRLRGELPGVAGRSPKQLAMRAVSVRGERSARVPPSMSQSTSRTRASASVHARQAAQCVDVCPARVV